MPDKPHPYWRVLSWPRLRVGRNQQFLYAGPGGENEMVSRTVSGKTAQRLREQHKPVAVYSAPQQQQWGVFDIFTGEEGTREDTHRLVSTHVHEETARSRGELRAKTYHVPHEHFKQGFREPPPEEGSLN